MPAPLRSGFPRVVRFWPSGRPADRIHLMRGGSRTSATLCLRHFATTPAPPESDLPLCPQCAHIAKRRQTSQKGS